MSKKNHGVVPNEDAMTNDDGDNSSASSFSSSSSQDEEQQDKNDDGTGDGDFRWSVMADENCMTVSERSGMMTSLHRWAEEEEDGQDDDDLYTKEDFVSDDSVSPQESQPSIQSTTTAIKKKKEKKAPSSSKKSSSKSTSTSNKSTSKTKKNKKKSSKSSSNSKQIQKPFTIDSEYDVEALDELMEKPKAFKRKKKNANQEVNQASEEEVEAPVTESPMKSPGSLVNSPSYMKKSIGSKIRMSLANLGSFRTATTSPTKQSLKYDETPTASPTNLPIAPVPVLDDITVSPKNETKNVDGKKLKQAIVPKIRAVAVMLGRLNAQKEFLAAFDEESEEEEENKSQDQSKKKGVVPKSPKKQPEQQKNLDILLKELKLYEKSLEEERKDMAEERNSIQLERQSFDQLLHAEMNKNFELEAKIESIVEETNGTSNSPQVAALKEQIENLRTENEVLKQRNTRHEGTIQSLMGRKQNQSYRGGLASQSLLGDSFVVGELPDDEYGSSEFWNTMDNDDDDNDARASQFSSTASIAKVQGELLQLRSSLNRKSSALEDQAKEIVILKAELKALGEQKGVEKMKGYIENLELEKKYFVEEIRRLKKELQKASSTTTQESTSKSFNESTSNPSGGWFGFGGSGKRKSAMKNPSYPGILNPVSQLPPQESRKDAKEAPVPKKRWSKMLDF